MDFIEILSFSFMQRALIGGVLIAIISGLMGVLMVLKRASFYADTISHASLTGVAFGILIGIDPVLSAAIYAVMIALVLPYLVRLKSVTLDGLLGFMLPFSMALGVILLSFTPGYRPELISYLFGNILSVSWNELYLVVLLVMIVGVIMIRFRHQLILVSFDKIQAKVMGINVNMMEMWFNILLALTIVAGIKLAGIVLINALLVIPASIVRIKARSLTQMFVMTPIVSVVLTVAGLLISIVLDIPSGPVIAVLAGLVFIVMLGWQSLFRK